MTLGSVQCRIREPRVKASIKTVKNHDLIHIFTVLIDIPRYYPTKTSPLHPSDFFTVLSAYKITYSKS